MGSNSINFDTLYLSFDLSKQITIVFRQKINLCLGEKERI